LDEGESCFSDIQTNLLDCNEGNDQWWKSRYEMGIQIFKKNQTQVMIKANH